MTSNNTQRPQSALSNRPNINTQPKRPVSSLSQRRPISRQSQRPQIHQTRSRLFPLCQELASHITGQRHSLLSENVFKSLESTYSTKAATTVDMATIDQQIRGRCVKAKIKSQDTFSEALEACHSQLKETVAQRNDLDDNIQRSRISDHLQFLLALSQPTNPVGLSYATVYLHRLRNPRPVTPELTWKDILEEERRMLAEENGSISGQSAGDPPSGNLSDGSSPSLSPWTSDDEDEAPEPISPPQITYHDHPAPTALMGTSDITRRKHSSLEVYEELRARQYWNIRSAPQLPHSQEFDNDIAKPSTLGPAFRELMSARNVRTSTVLPRECYIDEHNAVREVLFALQGCSSILFEMDSRDGVILKDTAPTVRHLSASAQRSILLSFGKVISAVQSLRLFAETRCQATASINIAASAPSVTLEAFADGIEYEVLLFDRWCSEREEIICKALSNAERSCSSPAVSLLSLEKALHDDFHGVFETMLGLTAIPQGQSFQPASIAQHLLDGIHMALHIHAEKTGSSTPTVQTLRRLFVTTLKPMWHMIGTWIYQGVHLNSADDRLEAEFFVERAGVELGTGLAMGLLDPDFWAEGYKLRAENGKDRTMVMPEFFKPVASSILGAGKAGGLLRVLDPGYTNTRHEWPSFKKILSSLAEDTRVDKPVDRDDALLSGGMDDLARMLYDFLLPRCDAVGTQLTRVLTADCELEYHVSAIQGLYLVGRSSMLDFMDIIFSKMDSSSRSWADFHFLNTAFSDVTSGGPRSPSNLWIQPALVRLSYRASMKDLLKDDHRQIKSIEGLAVEYAVPFPLCYLFHPAALEDYNDIFVFLLQLKRARHALDVTLKQSPSKDVEYLEGLKHLYALRGRLSWVVNTLSDFFSIHVVQSHSVDFKRKVMQAKSLDDMINLHEGYLRQMKRKCLLNPETPALRRGILTVLDLALQFSGLFIALAGSDEARASRQTIKLRPHRSRHRRNLGRNTMSFSASTIVSDSSDDSDGGVQEVSEGVSTLSVHLDENTPSRVDTVSRELDAIVRFLRRGVEGLSSQDSGSGSSFGVLEARLTEWDL